MLGDARPFAGLAKGVEESGASLRSAFDSKPLVATDVRVACLDCARATWPPVRKGESWDACRSLVVTECQKARHVSAMLRWWSVGEASFR